MHDIVLNWHLATVDRSHAILSPFWSEIGDLLDDGQSPDKLRPLVLFVLQRVAGAPDAFDSDETLKIVRNQVNCAEENSSARSLVLQHPVATALMIFRASRLPGFTGPRLNDLLVGPRKGTPGYTAASRFVASCFAAFRRHWLAQHICIGWASDLAYATFKSAGLQKPQTWLEVASGLPQVIDTFSADRSDFDRAPASMKKQFRLFLEGPCALYLILLCHEQISGAELSAARRSLRSKLQSYLSVDPAVWGWVRELYPIRAGSALPVRKQYRPTNLVDLTWLRLLHWYMGNDFVYLTRGMALMTREPPRDMTWHRLQKRSQEEDVATYPSFSSAGTSVSGRRKLRRVDNAPSPPL